MLNPTPQRVIPYALDLKLASLVLLTPSLNALPCCSAAYSQNKRFGSVAPKYGFGVETPTPEDEEDDPEVPRAEDGVIVSAELDQAEPDQVSM